MVPLLDNLERPTFDSSRSAVDRLTNSQPFLPVLLRLHTYSGRKLPFLESWVLILTARYLQTRALILDIQRPGGAGSSAVRTSTYFERYLEAT